MPNWKSAANLVKKIAENYELPYYTISPTYSVCTDHGYIAGEEYTCPICGKTTEVYSRITGYYRPVQNWNVGKSEEFKERKTYNIETSILTHGAPEHHESCVQEEKPLEVSETLLFTTKTCPNCKAAKAALDKAGISYKVIDAEENPSLAIKYGIMQAPTLVVSANGVDNVLVGLGKIRGYISEAV